jgi:hypothetical protein
MENDARRAVSVATSVRRHSAVDARSIQREWPVGPSFARTNGIRFTAHSEFTRSETEMPKLFAILTSVLKRGSRVPRSIF